MANTNRWGHFNCEDSSHLINNCPMSEGVSKVSKQANDWPQRSAWVKRVSGASGRANGPASGPVLQSVFLVILAHSVLETEAAKARKCCCERGDDGLCGADDAAWWRGRRKYGHRNRELARGTNEQRRRILLDPRYGHRSVDMVIGQCSRPGKVKSQSSRWNTVRWQFSMHFT